MNIIYFGDNNVFSTSLHRAKALERLGHNVKVYNPKNALQTHLGNVILNKFHFHSGYTLIQDKVKNWLSEILQENKEIDLVWVNSGEFFGSECVKVLRRLNVPIVLYNNDDPTGGRDGNRFYSLVKSLPYYDLCVVVRDINKSDFMEKGARRVIRVNMSYDELYHKPIETDSDIPSDFISDVAFIGTWMRNEKRDEFLLQLINDNIPVSIWGERWEKSSRWNLLKPYFRGKSIGGREYISAIQGAKVCLGLLSKGNRDQHTTRSLEIPYAGGVLCGERTQEHLAMYREGEEAFFWSTIDECSEICKKILPDKELLNRVRLAGMKKVRQLGVGNEDVCKKILSEVDSFSNNKSIS